MSVPSVPRTLSQLAVGATAVVAKVSGARLTVRRLLEMGLVPGTAVTVHREAPLGDPIELRVRNYSLSLRRAETGGIEVK